MTSITNKYGDNFDGKISITLENISNDTIYIALYPFYCKIKSDSINFYKIGEYGYFSNRIYFMKQNSEIVYLSASSNISFIKYPRILYLLPGKKTNICFRLDEEEIKQLKNFKWQPPPPTGEDNPTGWITMKDEYYSRDVSGKEIAVYQGYNLDYWNVWGTGNEGRIKSNGTRYFYLKDHLGSIRAVINQNNVIVQAQDYDPWGHIARSWDSTSTDYKFTGKERDNESNYDYFGARYYDARVGRWGAIDPLFEKHIQFNPYNYVLGNPMVLIDPDGKQLYITGKDAQKVFDEWDKYYLDFDNKSGRVGIKKNASKKDLNKVDLQIWNFVQNHSVKNKNAVMKILSLEQPFYNGKLFLGDGYGGNSFENDEYIGEQYLYLPHLMKMEKYSIMNKTVSHAIYEAIVGIIDGLNYDAAHEIAKNDVSEVNRLWFEAFKMQDGAIIKEGFHDKRNNTEYIFYIYDKDKGVFNEK